ncbi:peptidoglycan DD-metalloendopeptidase family protein [Entomomonas asaccharolytica]|uniref:Peptidoglycan DD-metalloendopeptidase family protein n=1 Tax=Entomomonas asaccharolytica TaxID=2785331 RepID=A0A974RW21_9GAMM|nr:peptidoglycan DD-metalloendopeptidase family protein [Entomomonas asaccharolytica]QQP84771.1 peptidoglycan DD-metalloendopeptidase family protein [Entomomonas asaccharolytica]
MATYYNPGTPFRRGSRFSVARNDPLGTRGVRPHKGDDWPAPAGTPIPAAADGEVIHLGFDRNGYGNYIVLEHHNNGSIVHTLYAHMQTRSPLAKGTHVTKNSSVGPVGTTGGSTGNHLHFEIRTGGTAGAPLSGTPVDPATYDISGLIDPNNTGNGNEKKNTAINSSLKFPVAQLDGKEYTADELYGLLADEDSGYYLLSANRLWHGGVHFTNKKFPQCVNDVPIRAIADGKVVAYRLNDVHEYVEQTISVTGETLAEPIKHRYSTGFCLIKHEYEIKKSEAQKVQEAEAKKQQEVQQRVQQTASQLNGQQITIKGGSRNRYSVTDGKVGANNDKYAGGTRLNIINVSETLHGDYYYAKVQQENITEEFFIALLDKEGNPLKSGGNPFFDMPQAATPNTPTQPATAQTTNNNQPSNTDGDKAKKNTDSYKLTFYSLYMHLSAYEDYLPKKGEKKQVQKQIFTIKATNLNVREKFRGEGGQAIGYISDGATIEAEINADTLKTTGNITDLKATIKSGSVTKGSTTVKQVGDVIWVPIRSGNNRYIVEALPQLPTPPKEKTRPNYWQGTVTAGVSPASKDQQNASGLEIYASKADLEKRVNRIAVLNANASNKFTYESDKVELIQSTDGKPSVLLAECKPAAGAQFSYAKGEPVAIPSVFWTTVDTGKSIIIEKLEPKQFNSVIKCDIDIKAGDALGYMGLYETPTQTGEQKSKRQVHVEVFISDEKDVNVLLNNPLKLTDGKQYIRLPKGTGLFDKPIPQSPATANATGTQPATTTPQASPAASYTLTRDHVFAIDKLTLEKDPDGKEWYVIAAEKHSGRVQKTATSPEVVNQYEWTKLGFQVVKETNSNSDGYLDLDKMPQIFKDIHTQIDTNKDGKIDESELQTALKDSDLRDQWCKFIAYHPTEWRVDTSSLIACFTKILISPFITGVRLLFGQSLLDQETKRMLKLSFWEKVGHANSTEVYHFHPVTFVEYISTTSTDMKLIWMKRVIKRYGNTVAEQFRSRIIKMGKDLQIDPNFIMACMALETVKTFDSAIKNPGSTATGLIQFMRGTAIALGTTTQALATMGVIAQLEYVEKYFVMTAKNVGVPTKDWVLEDVYCAIFTPSLIKQNLDYIAYSRGSEAYEKNQGHDRNKDGNITKREIAQNIQIYYREGFKEIA